MYRKFLIVLLAGWVTFSAIAQAPDTNITEGCVDEFDAEVDYFPDKIELTDAEKLSVEYFNNYKVITVDDAFDMAEQFHYVLVQCGTPAPSADEFPEGTQFIEVPAGNIISLQTTQLPDLSSLGLLDHLVGLDSFDYVNSPEVREMIDNGKLEALGFGSGINLELTLDLEPDIVMTSGYDPEADAHPVLLEAGVFTALNASWRETTPLGRAEWIKYTALFYNKEALAEEIYSEIATAYNDARELAATVPEEDRPVVLRNVLSPYNDGWSIPGTNTYIGALFQDAGGIVALAEEASIYLSKEAVYEGALDADIWLINSFGVNDLAGLLAIDERYGDFEAVANGNVWNNNLDQNENGGNNFFELGTANPHLILQDLIAIFHPELLPDHEFNFYRHLE